jgi:hypothetical protein
VGFFSAGVGEDGGRRGGDCGGAAGDGDGGGGGGNDGGRNGDGGVDGASSSPELEASSSPEPESGESKLSNGSSLEPPMAIGMLFIHSASGSTSSVIPGPAAA